jgi:hypothetical protein
MPFTTKTVIAKPTTYQQSTWAHVFGLGNLNASQTAVRIGRDSKFGLRHAAFLAFEGLKIPTNAKITNAFFRMNHFAGFIDGFDMKINFLKRDGRWDKSPFRLTEDWTDYPEYDGVFSLFTNLFQFVLTAPPSGITNANFSLRLDSGEGFIQQRYIGQSFVAEVTGKPALGGCFCRRVGVPVGDVWMELWTADPANEHRGLTKLAESARIDVSFISTVMDNKGFSFVGVNQVELTAGERYLVVMNGDFPFGLADGIQIGTRSVFFEGEYLGGRLTNFGQGDGFNFWNYGTEIKLLLEGPQIDGTPATWPLPFPVPMPSVIDSPNFKEMIQSWLSSPASYDPNGIIGFRFDENFQTVPGQLHFLLSVSKAQPQANPFPELHVTFDVPFGEQAGGAFIPSMPMRPQDEDEEETDTDEIELLQVLKSRR